MRRILFASLILAAAALAAESGAELFQKALTAERAAGNLEEAIKLYQRVAKEFASDRALAAKAIVQEARCYEKLGQNKAIQLYEQVAREYKDQPEPSAAASARLAVLRQPAAPTMTQRKIESPLGNPWQSATDGQRAIYIDYSANALMIRDADGSRGRMIYKPKIGESFSRYHPLSASRDLSMIFFRLVVPGGQVTNAVIKADGTGYRELFRGFPYGAVAPDWSWNHRYLLFSGVPVAALQGARNNAATESGLMHIGGGVVLVSLADGKSREIAGRSATVPTAAFSPDGRFLAFSEVPAPDVTGKTFVTPVQGGEPRLISGSANLLDWTSDGRFLAVSSRSSGAEALYLLPVKDGQSSGNPIFVRYGSFQVGRSNPNGSLTYGSIRNEGKLAFLARLDSTGHLGEWKPLDLNIRANAGAWTVSWSPDSTQIAYGSSHDDSGQPGYAVRVRNIATGEEREVYRNPHFLECIWKFGVPICSASNGATQEFKRSPWLWIPATRKRSAHSSD